MSEVYKLIERLEETGLAILGATLGDRAGINAEDVAAEINKALDQVERISTDRPRTR